MTERERLAADMRRAAWLADAMFGAAQLNDASEQPRKWLARPSLLALAAVLSVARQPMNLSARLATMAPVARPRPTTESDRGAF